MDNEYKNIDNKLKKEIGKFLTYNYSKNNNVVAIKYLGYVRLLNMNNSIRDLCMESSSKNMNDYNTFNNYVYNKIEELIYFMLDKYKKTEIESAGLRIIQIDKLCEELSLDAKKIVLDNLGIFDENFNYKKENSTAKLKFYLLFLLINHNKSCDKIALFNKMNNILKNFNPQYNVHSDPNVISFCDPNVISFCDTLVYNKLIDNKNLVALIKML
ncbi:hypothetical protein [Acanthamoeba castellanii mimivirus]|uniref:Uncharacterized protein R902 n=5 Tax=Mimivirus TaxID=315393 RepID=YR902_MIMIV|nr:hypothetical protein MIMI_gp0966 [Acanthamoeba polyphaga mimivirus]Q5UQZ6.1 RecName: Full=Uncharacterized protein R902 [Acanthamoeba polyphaga mimivirus]AEQ61121.1 hypothetical protein [Acanthamoeba castellanii mamavirus]AHA44919.1 hypothetical protein HIRU_S13 [Hirudovirus strain Sangsue]ALR84538.1 hypothetical protein [Niemeyer virus]AMK62102.1 hypothetical protein [Samba virus]AMZ03338.1 hypothetical protein [Mimivirus Bombay]EJN40517.1 hypothetical protein lvs_R792 [Acanthamoeba polyp